MNMRLHHGAGAQPLSTGTSGTASRGSPGMMKTGERVAWAAIKDRQRAARQARSGGPMTAEQQARQNRTEARET